MRKDRLELQGFGGEHREVEHAGGLQLYRLVGEHVCLCWG